MSLESHLRLASKFNWLTIKLFHIISVVMSCNNCDDDFSNARTHLQECPYNKC